MLLVLFEKTCSFKKLKLTGTLETVQIKKLLVKELNYE